MSWLRDAGRSFEGFTKKDMFHDMGTTQGRGDAATGFATGGASVLPIVSYRKSRASGMDKGEAVSTALTGGYTYDKNRQAAEGRKMAERSRKAEEGRQRRMQGQITGLRESYGIGTTPEAQAAAARLRAWQEQMARAGAGQATSAAGAGYQQALAQLRARLAQTGQMGGSLDAQQQNALMQQYAQQVAGAQQAGQQSAEQLREQMMRQRLGLEAQIRGNAIDPNALAAARNQLWIYQNQPSAAEIAGGRIAAQGASLYARQRENQARG